VAACAMEDRARRGAGARRGEVMRLVTFEAGAGPRLGAEHRGRIVDLQNAYCLREMFYAGAAAVERARAELPSDILAVLGNEAAGRAARETLAFVEQMPAAIMETLDAQG